VGAAANPAYGRYVEREIARLGVDHPLILTQYRMQTLSGQGRLLSVQDRALLQGPHDRLAGAVAGDTYVAGLDVGGTAELTGTAGHDASVLTIGRVRVLPGVGEQLLAVEVVAHYAWVGVDLAELWGALSALLRGTWRVTRVAVDATGLGEATAVELVKVLGSSRVDAVKMGQASKSELGYGLLGAVKAGRCRVYAGTSPEWSEFWSEARLCRVEYLPSRLMRWYVDEAEGHDDYVVSLALVVRAMEAGAPRVARGRELL